MRLTVVRLLREAAQEQERAMPRDELNAGLVAVLATLVAALIAVFLPYPLTALFGWSRYDLWPMTAVDVSLSILLTFALLLGALVAYARRKARGL